MNTGFYPHIPEDTLEEYVLGKLPDRDCAPLNEHLLVCSACQISLQDMDEYVNVMKAAIAALPRTHLKHFDQCGFGSAVLRKFRRSAWVAGFAGFHRPAALTGLGRRH